MYVDFVTVLSYFYSSISPCVFIQSPSNLGTMILRYWGLMRRLFLKKSQLFFRIYSWFSKSLCGSMSVQRCTCRVKPYEWNYWPNNRALCERRQDRLAPFEHTLYLIIKEHISNHFSCGPASHNKFNPTKCKMAAKKKNPVQISLLLEKSHFPSGLVHDICLKTYLICIRFYSIMR